MDDKELKETLRKIGIEDTDGSYRIDPETGKVQKEGWLGWSDTGYRIDKESGKVQKEGWFGWSDTGVRVEKDSGRVKEDKCIITTACIEAMGLPDDCNELNILRDFRDTYLRSLPEGNSLISQYYSIAPRILRAIDRKPNAREIYHRLYRELVPETVDLVKAGKHKEAFENCFKIIMGLEQKYLG